MCSFYGVETLFWTAALLIFIFFLVGVCGACWWQRVAFKGEGSLVGSGEAAWAVGHAQQALLSAELSCWPPTLVFKSSSVLWYWLLVSKNRDLCFFLLFSFSSLESVHLNPLSAVSFFLGLMQCSPCSWFLLPSVQNCVFLLVFLKQQFPPLQESLR